MDSRRYPLADDGDELRTPDPVWPDPVARPTETGEFPSFTDEFATTDPASDDGGLGDKAADLKDKAADVAGTAQQKAGEVADQAQQKAGELTGQAHTMSDKGLDSAAAGLGQAASMLREQGEGRDGTLGTAAGKTAETLDQASTYLRDHDTDQLVTDLEAMVRQRPVESVLVAAGIGFLLSKIFS
jgi:ElaB/YqjD/DUF883 family membrane-anchored ribosome-binding protein